MATFVIHTDDADDTADVEEWLAAAGFDPVDYEEEVEEEVEEAGAACNPDDDASDDEGEDDDADDGEGV